MKDSNTCLKVCHSTEDTFYGSDVGQVWSREERLWQIMQNKSPEYPFPHLEQSIYTQANNNKVDKSINKPVFIQDMKWSHDGTSISSVSNDSGIRQYLIPEEGQSTADEEEDGAQSLTPFIRKFKNRSIVCSEIHPLNSMYDDIYNYVLLASKNVPIQMYSLSAQFDSKEEDSYSNVRHTYKIMNDMNEKFEIPYSMKIFENRPDMFFSGGLRNKIKMYDVNRTDPLSTYNIGKGGPKSIISCFEDRSSQYVMNDKVFFWGNYKNEIGSLDTRTDPKHFKSTINLPKVKGSFGDGIYQIIRSVSGHYLYIFSRQSRSVQVLDSRQIGSHVQAVNRLYLPFKIGYQQCKAAIDEDLGLIMGNRSKQDEIGILQWDKSLIETGGRSREWDTKSDEYTFNIISTNINKEDSQEKTNDLHCAPNSSIHMLARNLSSQSLQLAVATSSNRSKTLPTDQHPMLAILAPVY